MFQFTLSSVRARSFFFRDREAQKLISPVNREKSFIKKDYVQLKFELRIEVEGESRRATKPEAEKCSNLF